MPDSPDSKSSAPSTSGAAKAAGLDGAPFTEADLLALPLVTRAILFAAWMHRKQKRKYGGGEYIAHPMTVASTVGVLGAGPEAFAAALLHDTVEDTAARFEQLEQLFGAQVKGWVEELTSPKFPDKALRMEYFRNHLAGMTRTTTQIKLSDRLSNLNDCGGADTKFITRYTSEALVIVEAVRPEFRADPIVKALSDRIRARVAELAVRVVDA